jgi:hypothetical protein
MILRGWCEILNLRKRAKIGAWEVGMEGKTGFVALEASAGIALAAARAHAGSQQEE